MKNTDIGQQNTVSLGKGVHSLSALYCKFVDNVKFIQYGVTIYSYSVSQKIPP